MKGYFRTQWFSIFLGLLNLGFCIKNIINEEALAAIGWLLSALVWLVMSRVDYNCDRITALEKKAEKYDALCELVEALREANEVNRDHLSLHDKKINCIADYIDTELKR